MPESPGPAERRALSRLRVVAALCQELGAEAPASPDFPSRIKRAFAARPQLGSRDRRELRELLFTAARHQPWVASGMRARGAAEAAKLLLALSDADASWKSLALPDWPWRELQAADLPARARILNAFWPGLELDPMDLLPGWFAQECPALAGERGLVLLRRAPLWLRLQAEDPGEVAREFASLGWSWSQSALLPGAWRLDASRDLTRTGAYARGRVEVQDLGSQLLLEAAAPPAGGRWLDLCAGAGGKTLQLARRLGSAGAVDAADVRPAALHELLTRCQRARLSTVRAWHIEHDSAETPPRVRPLEGGPARPLEAGAYDGVLVDAPCSGSGTWRRQPHARFSLNPERLRAHAALQLKLLGQGAVCVRPGGVLLYATCSVCRTENESVIAAFLAGHAQYEVEPVGGALGFCVSAQGSTLLPDVHDTDGFFLCLLRRRGGD